MTSARTIRFRTRLVVALTAIVLGGCGGAHERYRSHLERGKQYLQQENLDKAGIEFRNALQIQPKDPDALYFAGRVAEERGNPAEAVGFFQAAIDARPDFDEARARLGKTLVLGGAAKRAQDVVEPALTKHPDNADLLAVRAATRHQLKDDVGARADGEHAVQADPTNEDAIAILAALYTEGDDKSKAVDLVAAAVSRAPSSVQLHVILANLYLKTAQPDKAEEQMRKVIELRPHDLAPRTQLAMHFVQANQLDAAQRVLEEAVKDFAKDPDRSRTVAAKLELVDFIVTKRSREQGEKTLRGFIAAEPNNEDLRFGLGALLQRTGAPQEAIAVYREVLQREGTDAQGLMARDRIARVLLSQGHRDEAKKLIGEVLQKSPRDNDALIMRANIALANHDPTSAIVDLRAVVREQPKSAPVQRMLAQAYLDKGESALAEEAFRAALEAAPADTSLLLDFARFLVRTDRAARAIPVLEDLLKHAPDDMQARAVLVQAHLENRNLSAARAAADELKTRHPDSPVGFYLAGLIASRERRLADSQQDLEHALALRPQAVDVLTFLTQVEQARGQGANAIARVQADIERDPGNVQLQNLLGELYLGQKDFARATEAFTRASALDPRGWLPHRNLARVKLATEDPAGAIAQYRAAMQIAPAEPQLVIELTSIYEKQGRVDEAIACYEALYGSNPQAQQLAANNLAMLLVTYKTDKASLDRARDLTLGFALSQNTSLLDTNGWVRFKRGEYQDAAAVLEQAAARAPDSSVIRYHLAMVQLRLGQKERALSNLETALAGSASFSGADEARVALASLKARSG